MLRNTYLNIAQVYQKMEMFDLMNSYLKQGDSIEVIGVDVDMLTPLLKGYRAINLKNYKEAIEKVRKYWYWLKIIVILVLKPMRCYYCLKLMKAPETFLKVFIILNFTPKA